MFTAFRSQFVIDPPAEIRQPHRKLRESVSAGYKLPRLPKQDSPPSVARRWAGGSGSSRKTSPRQPSSRRSTGRQSALPKRWGVRSGRSTPAWEGREQRVPAHRLLDALETDFADDDVLRITLREEAPKVGNYDDRADALLVTLFDLFADACAAAGDNGRGGRFRPGSGSAMYYVWLARGHEGMREPVVGATADGRKAGDLFSSSLAPSPGITVRGPISVLQSFAVIDYGRICNGGPITMELSDTVFRGEDSLEKVARLIRSFAVLGGQQLQLNSLNVEALRDAQRHPEKYRNLIVRVWGWSGYFCELDKVYQDHIIARHVYGT